MRVEYLWFRELNNNVILTWFRELNNNVILTWQRRGGGVHSGEREEECGKEAVVRAALKDGELEAAARLLRAGRRQKRDSGGR